MQKPLIELKNIYKSYAKTKVLDNVSLNVYPGEFLTLLGPSGCGKTTLLRLISGFEEPYSGEIFINQRCVNKLPPQQRDVHTVFQSYALFPHLNVFENVAFSLRCQKINDNVIVHRVMEALQLVHLENFSNRRPDDLSGGQQQRVAIARAIINRPQVLLLDEPLSSLDYRLRKAMQEELKQLQKTLNITFVFVTHDQEEALSMSDRIVIFQHGHIAQIGTPRQVYETPNNLYVAKFIGEANIFEVKVLATEETTLSTVIESVPIICNNTHNYLPGDLVYLVIRPEDIRVEKDIDAKLDVSDEVPHSIEHGVTSHRSNEKILGIISGITYKGSTVDLKIQLSSGKHINASTFFNEDDDQLEYTLNERVWITWFSGWEVLLPYE